jgi:tryptophan synthase alpha chain
MNRFSVLRERQRKWFAAYVTLGDPQSIVDQVGVYLECGVDVLEVGVPHLNPFMDGPLVADSMRRAVEDGVDHSVAREKLTSLRHAYRETPIVLMGYADLSDVISGPQGEPLADAILQMGVPPSPRIARDVARVGFISHAAAAREIARARSSGGYIMLQANEGKTGIRASLPADNARKLELVRSSGVQLPVLLGIGVSDAHQVARAMSFGADGVVMGSACLQAAQSGAAQLRAFLRTIRAALDDPGSFLQ